MVSEAKSRSLAGARRRAQVRPSNAIPPTGDKYCAKTESVDSDEPAPSSSGFFDTAVPRFDLENTFPAILKPISFLRKVPENQDLDALRALAPVFCSCLDAILYSMSHLPEGVRSSPKYHLAHRGVNFSREMFVAHTNQLSTVDASQRHDAIDMAMQYLDMTMSSLKAFIQVAAYEVAQSKPLPEPPAQDEPDHSTEEPDAEDTTPSSSGEELPSIDSHSPDFEAPSEPIESGDPPNLQQKPRKGKLSALLNMSIRRKAKKHGPEADPAGPESSASSTLVNTERSDLTCSYVHVSKNIRHSLARFPDCVEGAGLDNVPHPEDSTELRVNSKGLVELASLKALVRYLTSKASDNDPEITDVFFLCFRYFSNPLETLNTLLARYDEKMPDDLSPVHARKESMYIKMRIAKVLYFWVDLHWRAEDDAAVFGRLTQFAFSRLARDLPREASSKLVNALHDRSCNVDNSRGLRVQRTIELAECRLRSEFLRCTWEPREKKSMLKGDFSKVKLQHFNSPGGHSMLALQVTLFFWEKYSAFAPEDAVRYLMERKGDDSMPTTEVARKVASFISFEKALHRWVMDCIASASSVEARTELMELLLEWASKCHELRNYSGSCLISLACDRPTVLPFVTTQKISPRHEQMKSTLSQFYTQGNNHLKAYKQALQSCSCAALPGMMLFMGEVARGCGSGPYSEHPAVPGSRLINLNRYRPITWAVRAMERCHVPFKIERVDYICDWLEHALSDYLGGTEMEWEQRIYDKCRKL
ncbi:ras guanine nucleotide exchange factor domain-containing protein [Phlebopus sp. FC_14]|nr:ras guanine nucleotide exchange factor domain-containing protein [Phlebopus sp. FC_14]